MRPLRVAHVLWRLSPTGGIPRVVRDLALTLDPQRVELHVITVRPAYPDDHLDGVIDPGRFRSAGHPLGAPRLRLLPALVRLTRHLRAVRPDVIHLHSGTSWLGLPGAMSMPRAHRVLEIHDEPQSGRSGRPNVALMKLSARRLRFHVLVHSTVVRERTAEAVATPEERITLVPLGVDVDRYRPDPTLRAQGRERLGISDDQRLVAWVGRLEPLKRPRDALAVARAVGARDPRVMFAIAGAGTESAALERTAAELPNVELLGRVDDLTELLNAADLFLSTSGYEGFGLGVAEAMACGLPVVSTRAGGVVDLVADGDTGRLEAIGDIGALAERVAQLAADPETAARMGASARDAAVHRFARTATARGYEQLYERLAGDRDQGPTPTDG